MWYGGLCWKIIFVELKVGIPRRLMGRVSRETGGVFVSHSTCVAVTLDRGLRGSTVLSGIPRVLRVVGATIRGRGTGDNLSTAAMTNGKNRI